MFISNIPIHFNLVAKKFDLHNQGKRTVLEGVSNRLRWRNIRDEQTMLVEV